MLSRSYTRRGEVKNCSELTLTIIILCSITFNNLFLKHSRKVILFAADAIQQMGADGIFVLLEGREQTVNYVRTPLRFTLTMSDMTLIGKRRAAQRLAAGALGLVGENASEEEIGKALENQLEIMVKEHT